MVRVLHVCWAEDSGFAKHCKGSGASALRAVQGCLGFLGGLVGLLRDRGSRGGFMRGRCLRNL